MFIYPNHGCNSVRFINSEASANREEASHGYTELHAVVSHCFVFTCLVNLKADFQLIDKVDEGKQNIFNEKKVISLDCCEFPFSVV